MSRDLYPRGTDGGSAMNDPIVDEIRRIRNDYAKRFGYDLNAMAADLRKKEETHRDQLVSFPPKPVRRSRTA